MKWRYVVGGGAIATVLGLAAGLAGVGISNIDKPSQISRLNDEIQDTNYPVVPPESRRLPRTGPSLPSPGYEN